VSPRVFSLRSSCTKLDVCGSLTPTVFYPDRDYQNLCIGQLACSYETLNHLSCQNSKNDNLSVCERKSQLQGVEDYKASSILPWLSSSLPHFSSGSTSKKENRYIMGVLRSTKGLDETLWCTFALRCPKDIWQRVHVILPRKPKPWVMAHTMKSLTRISSPYSSCASATEEWLSIELLSASLLPFYPTSFQLVSKIQRVRFYVLCALVSKIMFSYAMPVLVTCSSVRIECMELEATIPNCDSWLDLRSFFLKELSDNELCSRRHKSGKAH
jgi:hypothetical protein